MSVYRNFTLPSWAQNLGGGLIGSGAGITFESLGFLVGIPAAGTGLYTYLGACKGDKNCEAKVTNWFNNAQQNLNNSLAGPSAAGTQQAGAYGQGAYPGATAPKAAINWKPIIVVSSVVAAVLVIGIIFYKIGK